MKALNISKINRKRRRARRRKPSKSRIELIRLYNSIIVNPKSNYILVCGDFEYYVSHGGLVREFKHATPFNSYTIAEEILKWRKYKIRPVNLKKFLKKRKKQIDSTRT